MRAGAAWVELRGDTSARLVQRAVRPTMSELELEVQEALLVAGLPAPRCSSTPSYCRTGGRCTSTLRIRAWSIDIEVDHSEWHATPTAVAQDKQRDLGLADPRLGAVAVHGSGRQAQRHVSALPRSVPSSSAAARATQAHGALNVNVRRSLGNFSQWRPSSGRHRGKLTVPASRTGAL